MKNIFEQVSVTESVVASASRLEAAEAGVMSPPVFALNCDAVFFFFKSFEEQQVALARGDESAGSSPRAERREEKAAMSGAAQENCQRLGGEQRKGNSSVMSCRSNPVMTH